jgi:Sulfatase
MPRPWDRRLAILAGLIATPYVVTALMLVLYFQIDESVSRHFGILLTTEYQSPIVWGAVPVLLMWLVDHNVGWTRRLGHCVLVLFVAAIATARAAQTVAVLQTRNFLDSEVFEHAGMIEFVLTTRNVSVFLGILLLPLLLVGMLWLPAFPERRRSHKLYIGLLTGCLALSWFASYRADSKKYLEHFTNKHGIPHAPELAMFQLLIGHDGSDAEESETLSTATRENLEAFGVFVNPDAQRPFRRDRVFDAARATPWTKFDQPPDIVVVFVESLSASLLGCYSDLPADVSPWMDDLAGRSLKFDNYYNHATPTVCGLHGSLTSSYQVSSHDTFAGPEVRILAGSRALSLGKILADRGYDTAYFGSGSRHETHLGEMMGNLGFARQLFRDELLAEYPDVARRFAAEYPDYRYTGHVSDILMFRYVQRFMARPSSRPRLLCVSTIGTHFPYEFGEGVRYGDGSRPILNSIHTLDRALADTTDYLNGGDREVLFVLTADHAMFPTMELVRLLGEDYSRFFYDRIALLIHRSGHDRGATIETLSSSVDLVPTLLHLLDINLENPFMGWSIFGRRREFPRLLGSHNKNLFVKTAAGEWSPTLARIDEMPDIALDEGRVFQSGQFREWLAYLRYQIRHHRIW